MAEILTNHQAEALDIDNHLALTANAGSGKTFVLKKRYVEILLQGRASIGNIAAITFTEKAAADLYKKIAEEIESRIKSEKKEEIIKKLERLRRQLVSANISTIHSFCINILREFPVEAGLDANFIPIDSNLSNELIELSVEETIRNSFDGGEKEKDLKSLIRIFGSKTLFAIQLINLIKNRKNIQTVEEEIYNKTEDEIAGYFYSTTVENLQKIFLVKKDKILNTFQEIIDDLKNDDKKKDLAFDIDGILHELKGNNSIINLFSLFNEIAERCFTKKGDRFNKRIFSKDFYEKYELELDEIAVFIGEFLKFGIAENHHEIELELAKTGKNLLKFFNLVVDAYDQKKQENSYLDFEDILLLTRKILENEFVRQSLSEKFKYVMVDEYQDTNEIQYRIFLPILENLKKGNLFVVGDEKQSIYMFRDAEMEVYNRTKSDIIESEKSGRILSLPDSFRMSPNLCAFINELFGKLFEKQENIFGDVSYSELVSAKDYDFDGKVEILISPKNQNEETTEPEFVVKRINKLIKEENLNFKDIAILCRKRKYFTELEKEFIKYKIPYSILGGKGFYQRQSVYDIYNYFSFLIDKKNGPALVGILRSPFFNVSDSKIFEISLAEGENYWEKLNRFGKRDSEISKIIKILSKNLELAGSSSASQILRKILKESDFLSVLSSKPNGDQEIANINKLISLTVNFSEEQFKNLYDYVDFLKSSIQKIEDESQAEISDENNSVSIITIHQSKGLEFKAVFLYKSDEKPELPSVKKKSIYVDKKFGILTKVPLNGNYFEDYYSAPILGLYDYINKGKQLAEFKRLFYVAATRAKDYLFISCSAEVSENDDNSFAGLLGNAFKDSLSSQKLSVHNNLKFIVQRNNKFESFSRLIEFDVPIIREIEDINFINEPDEKKNTEIKFSINELKDNVKGEIISATKIAVYSQCPLKYHLIYDLGFSEILNRYKFYQKNIDTKKANYDFSGKEDSAVSKDTQDENNSLTKFSALKGKLIHKILEEEIRIENTAEFIDYNLRLSNEDIHVDNEIAEALKGEIVQELKKFYSSEIYQNLKILNNYKNEFEVYVKNKDYLLYGIIDKVAFEKDRIYIFDYKTDNIDEKEIDERAKTYFTQLRFYAYILSELFPDIQNFDLRIIFIKYPAKKIELGLDRESVHRFGDEINKIIQEIRNSGLPAGQAGFSQNQSHCASCLFAINNKCIKTN